MILTMAMTAMLAFSAEPPRAPYVDEILQWRHKREERLKADGGWLTVAGLFWLKEGDNTFGADPSSDIVLPEGAPARAGVFRFHDGKTVVAVAPGVTATIGGAPVGEKELAPDSAGTPDVMSLGALTMHVIQRGDRYAIRLKDLNSRFRKEFTGLHWYPVSEAHRISARFEPYDKPKMIRVPTILGTTEEMPCPGVAVFTVDGREVRMEPVLEAPGDTELFLIFKDGTAGKETYPAGRFLYAPMPKDGRIELDFNKAYNPPCAFTPYATCPLPPEGNRTPARIEAGELSYGHH